jgi:hypothetical protein
MRTASWSVEPDEEECQHTVNAKATALDVSSEELVDCLVTLLLAKAEGSPMIVMRSVERRKVPKVNFILQRR